MKTNQRAFLRYADELQSIDKKPEVKKQITKNPEPKKQITKKPEAKKPEAKKPEVPSWAKQLINPNDEDSKSETKKPEIPSWIKQGITNDISTNKPSVTYTVKPGDSLSKIAAKYDKTVTAETIKKLNGLKTDKIDVGQKLKIK
jgi:LysM repeat protein